MPAPSDWHDGIDERDTHPRGGQPEIDRQGDFRGPFGYGRPTHGSDPNARYGFDINLVKGKRPR